MRRVFVSLLLAGWTAASFGCGAAASGLGRAAAGAGARTAPRVVTTTLPKVVTSSAPRAVTPVAGGAAKSGSHTGGGLGHFGPELGQQALTGGFGDDGRRKK